MLYKVYNSAMATTAAPVAQPTGTVIRTMMQLRAATGYYPNLHAWGCSLSGFAAAAPGTLELIEVDVAATMSTAYAAADIQPYDDDRWIPNTAGASGVPWNLSTTTSGFMTTSGTEGTPTVSRMADVQLIAPTNEYFREWSLGRSFKCKAQSYLRIRATFAVTVNMICWVILEV